MSGKITVKETEFLFTTYLRIISIWTQPFEEKNSKSGNMNCNQGYQHPHGGVKWLWNKNNSIILIVFIINYKKWLLAGALLSFCAACQFPF